MKPEIDIELSTGKTGEGPLGNVRSWGNVDRLSQAGEIRFELPLADPRSALASPKRIARCFGIVNGVRTVLGAGVIDALDRQAGADALTVTGGSIARELTYRSVHFLELTDGSGGGVADALAQIMAFAPPGWTFSGATSKLVYAEFAGESVLSALVKMAQKLGDHFRITPDRQVIWFSTFTDSGVVAVKNTNDPAILNNPDVALITDLNPVEDTYELLTRVYPYGAGNAEARLTLAAATDPAPAGYMLNKAENYLERNDAVAAYGRIERSLGYKDIAPISNTDADMAAAANVLLGAAYQELRVLGQPGKFYRLSITKLDRALLPGQTIRVVYREFVDGFAALDVDEVLIILETVNQVDERGVRTVGLTVANVDRWPSSDQELMASQLEEGRVFEAHPQMSANSYVVSYREPMDSSKSAQFDFWLGPEVVTVNQVVLRFRVDPLRSTVKSAAAGGGGAVTSASGGGQTATGGGHVHNTNVPNRSGNTPIEWYQDSGFVTPVSPSSEMTFQVGVNNNHDHTINAHTHSVTLPTHAHAMTYGIFEEAGGNTLVESDLSYSVNGSVDLGGSVVDIGGGWYELDLTDQVVNPATMRPKQKTNQLVISTGTAKTAQITGQLVVRTVIQATALI